MNECHSLKPKEFQSELKRQIQRDSRFVPLMLIAVSVVFPLLEGVLINIWTSAQMSGPAGLCLALVGVLHLMMSGLLIVNEFRSKNPLRILADAADLADVNCSTQRELDRRIMLYRMFRDSIETMNNQVCSLQGQHEAFDKTLRPVLKRFIDSVCETLGVCSNRYTLEVYLQEDLIAEGQEHPQLCGYKLAFFESPTLSVEQALSMDTTHPLCLASATEREKMMGRASADSTFFGGEDATTYFEQYATHMIPTQCGTGHLGFVVFTTPQSDPIAHDALETLGLLATILSSFYARWADCELARRQAEQNRALRSQNHMLLHQIKNAARVVRGQSPNRPQRAAAVAPPARPASVQASADAAGVVVNLPAAAPDGLNSSGAA